jgi:hypothetical protein
MNNYYEDLPEDQYVPLECIDRSLIGKYEINKMGNIRNIKTGVIKTSKANYPQITFNSGGKTISYFIHRLVAITFIPNPNNLPYVDHIGRNPKNYHISNLRWVDGSTNSYNRERKSVSKYWVIKLDNEQKPVDKINYNNIKSLGYCLGNIQKSIKTGKKYKGFYWKILNEEVESYIKEFGEPDDLNWKPSLRDPDILCNSNGLLKVREVLTIGTKDNRGYRVIESKGVRYKIHRLIFETFSGKLLEEGEIIDHLDTIIYHNSFSNLSVGTQKDNMNNLNTLKKRGIGVVKYDLLGNKLDTYISISRAAKSITNGDPSAITRACNKKYTTAYGFIWRYEGDSDLSYSIDNIYYKYDSNRNLVDVKGRLVDYSNGDAKLYKSILYACQNGNICPPDGYYYSKGPRTIFK